LPVAGFFEIAAFPPSKTGASQFQSDETHTTGFLMIDLKSNLDAFFSALDKPGAKRQINPTKTRSAIALLKGFLCIGASFNRSGTPCRKIRREKADSRKPNHSHPRRIINLDNCKQNVKDFFYSGVIRCPENGVRSQAYIELGAASISYYI
jgi:hypothetical protein